MSEPRRRLKHGEAEAHILAALAAGPIRDGSGRATIALAERVGLSPAWVNPNLRKLADAGQVVREVRGRRTFMLCLPGMESAPSQPPPPQPEPAEPEASAHDGAGAPQTESPADGAREPTGETPIDYGELALALLSRVAKIVGAPDEAKERLAETLVDNERWRQKVRGLEIQVEEVERSRRAVVRERDGLRLRVKTLEDNLQATVKSESRIVDAEVTKRIDRFMRERPNAKAPV